jgi:cobaltochelatase CobN
VLGGLANAIKNIDGKSPDIMITNTRNAAKPEMTSIYKFLGTKFRSRYVNPTWIERMQKEGYAGAGEDTVLRRVPLMLERDGHRVGGRQYVEGDFDVYVRDKHKLGMRAFFEKSSPFAYQDITARMEETIRKWYWKADGTTQKKLLEEYLESVNQDFHGSQSCRVPTNPDYESRGARGTLAFLGGGASGLPYGSY